MNKSKDEDLNGDDALATQPNENDVLLGRGTGPNEYKGNIRYRDLVLEALRSSCGLFDNDFGRRKSWQVPPSGQNEQEKIASGELAWQTNKNALAKQIVHQIQARNGRFLRQVGCTRTKRGSNKNNAAYRFEQVEDSVAIMKTKQAFRHQMRTIRAQYGGTRLPKKDSGNRKRQFSSSETTAAGDTAVGAKIDHYSKKTRCDDQSVSEGSPGGHRDGGLRGSQVSAARYDRTTFAVRPQPQSLEPPSSLLHLGGPSSLLSRQAPLSVARMLSPPMNDPNTTASSQRPNALQHLLSASHDNSSSRSLCQSVPADGSSWILGYPFDSRTTSTDHAHPLAASYSQMFRQQQIDEMMHASSFAEQNMRNPAAADAAAPDHKAERSAGLPYQRLAQEQHGELLVDRLTLLRSLGSIGQQLPTCSSSREELPSSLLSPLHQQQYSQGLPSSSTFAAREALLSLLGANRPKIATESASTG